jgi:hypothetical protein
MDEPSDLATGYSSSDGDAAGAGYSGLGPMDRSRSLQALSFLLYTFVLAWLVGFRNGGTW